MSSQDARLTPTSSSSSLFSSLSHDNLDLSSDPIWFARLQEILLMHRPFDFCALLIVVELIFGFIYFLNLGIFATIALLGLIAYMLFIHYCHPNPIFEKIFFPPLKKPIDQTQPNRIRSYEEFSNFIASVHHGFQHYFGHKHLTGIKRIIFGVGSFIFALLLKRVVPFWVNFLLVHCILFLPLAILRPWPNKDAPGEEPRPEETTAQAAAQTTQTEATQAAPEAQITLPDTQGNENANSGNNQESNGDSSKNDSNLNNDPEKVIKREIILEETDEDPLKDNGQISNSFSTPSAKSNINSNDNNLNLHPTPISTPSQISTPHVSSPPHKTTPIQKVTPNQKVTPTNRQPETPSAALPPVPPPQQASTPKPTTTSKSKLKTKSATTSKLKVFGKSKSKLKDKGKSSQDQED